jgi:hypothetical protein
MAVADIEAAGERESVAVAVPVAAAEDGHRLTARRMVGLSANGGDCNVALRAPDDGGGGDEKETSSSCCSRIR